MTGQVGHSPPNTDGAETAEAQLKSIIEHPEAHDFGDDFLNGGRPVGMTQAKEVSDPQLLRRYRDLCAERLPGDHFAENPMVRERADEKYNLLDELDARIETASFPERHEWPVSPEFVEFVSGLSLPSRMHGYAFDRQGWERVWDACSADDLQFIRRALTYAPGFGTPGQSQYDDVLATFLHYCGAEDIKDLFEISTRGDGPPERVVAQNLEDTLERLDPVIGAVAVHWIRRVTTNVSESGNGKYRRAEQRINLSTDSTISRERDRGGFENTTAHEVGHALHHLYGFWVEGGDNVDNRDRHPSEWEWGVRSPSHDQTTTSQDAFRTVIRQVWEDIRDGELAPLKSYQLKNADEVIAVAFECWIVDSNRLKSEQPRLKQLFDAHFGKQDYTTKQIRLSGMPAP